MRSNPETTWRILISAVSVSCDIMMFLDLTLFRHLRFAEMVLFYRNNAAINTHVETQNRVKHPVWTLTRDPTQPNQIARWPGDSLTRFQLWLNCEGWHTEQALSRSYCCTPYDIVAKQYILEQVSEQVNRKCPLGTRFYNFWPHTLTLSPQTPPAEFHDFPPLYLALLNTWPICLICWRELRKSFADGRVLLSRWRQEYDRLFLSNSCTSCFPIHLISLSLVLLLQKISLVYAEL